MRHQASGPYSSRFRGALLYQRIDASLIGRLLFQIQLHLSGFSLRTDGTSFILVLVKLPGFVWGPGVQRCKEVDPPWWIMTIQSQRLANTVVGSQDAISAADGAHA
jgi:hypothetical protein